MISETILVLAKLINGYPAHTLNANLIAPQN